MPESAEAWATAARKAATDNPSLRPLVSDLLRLVPQQQRLSRLGGTLVAGGGGADEGGRAAAGVVTGAAGAGAGAPLQQGQEQQHGQGQQGQQGQQQQQRQQEQGQQQGQGQQHQVDLAAVVATLRALARDLPLCLRTLVSQQGPGEGDRAAKGQKEAGDAQAEGPVEGDAAVAPGGCSFDLASAAYLRYREQQYAHTSLHLPP